MVALLDTQEKVALAASIARGLLLCLNSVLY